MAANGAAPGRQVIAAATCRFSNSRVPAAGWGDLAIDTWTTPHNNPMVASLPFLQWTVPAAPAAAIVDRFQLQGVFLLAMQPDTPNQSPVRSYANVVVHELD